MKKKVILKWVNMVAFAFLVIGGINFLLMGLFNFDMFAAIFGGNDAVVSRVFYSLFGIAAVTLLATVLWKAFMSDKMKQKPAKSAKTTTATA